MQKRRDQDDHLLAEIVSWFDVVAIQECHDNLAGIKGIKANLPSSGCCSRMPQAMTNA